MVLAPLPRLLPGSPKPWEMYGEDYWLALRTFYLTIWETEDANRIERDLVRYGALPLGYLVHSVSTGSFPAVCGELFRKEYHLQGHIDTTRAVVAVDLPDDLVVRHWWPYFDMSGRMMLEPPWYEDFVSWWAKYISPGYVPATRPVYLEVIKKFAPFYEKQAGTQAYCIEFPDIVNLVDPNSRHLESITAIYKSGVYAPSHRSIVEMTHWRGEKTKISQKIQAEYSNLSSWSWEQAHGGDQQVSRAMSAIEKVLALRHQARTSLQDAEMHHLVWLALREMLYGIGWIVSGSLMFTNVFRAADFFPKPGVRVSGHVHPPGTEDWPDELIDLSLSSSVWQPDEALEPLRKAVIEMQGFIATNSAADPKNVDTHGLYGVCEQLIVAFLQFAKSTWPDVYPELQLLVRMADH